MWYHLIELEHSRRDDLESVSYVLLFLLKGSLPWQGLILNEGEDRCKMVFQKKKETPISELCKGAPGKTLITIEQFQLFVKYCRGLKFEEEPKYDYLINILVDILEGKKIPFCINEHNNLKLNHHASRSLFDCL